jgi:hypothetical protein
VSNALLGIGEEGCEEILNGDFEAIDQSLKEAGRSQATDKDWLSTTGQDKKNLDQSGQGDIEAQAMNHGDLFREDRGRAAIEEGEEGFDDEMGGQTQNVVAMYEEGGMELPENPQDGYISDGDHISSASSTDAPTRQRSETAVAANIRIQQKLDSDDENISSPSVMEEPTRRHLETSAAGSVRIQQNVGSEDENVSHSSNQEETTRQQSETSGAARMQLQQSLNFEPKAHTASARTIDTADSSPETNAPARRFHRPSKVNNGIKESRNVTSDAGKSKTYAGQSVQAAPRAPIIKLMGLSSANPVETTFSAADLPLPTYGKSKKKKSKKKVKK